MTPRSMIALLLLLSGCGGSDATTDTALASEALVWGYPLVVSERTMQSLGTVIGVNKLFNQATLAGAGTRVIVSPNQDTLYSVAVLDLRAEPVVLTVPDVTDRYWTFQFLDAWTNSFAYVGTRATGGIGGSFLIAPPGWKGTPPPSVKQVIESPTAQLFLLGRYLARDDADAAKVVALSRSLVPLHQITGEPAPAPPPPIGIAPGSASDVGGDGATFFDELGDALAINGPTSDADESALQRYSKLGIGAGLHPGTGANAATLSAGVIGGLNQVQSQADAQGSAENGWIVRLNVGTYPNDILLRAVIAKLAWGANIPTEAVYAISLADSSAQPYRGDTPRIMHFPSGQLPSVDADLGFWSLTLYGPDRFFVDNPQKRFAISDRTPGVVKNADDSLDFFIQHDPPTGHEDNWLPAPAGEYTLMLRLYLPTFIGSTSMSYPPVAPR